MTMGVYLLRWQVDIPCIPKNTMVKHETSPPGDGAVDDAGYLTRTAGDVVIHLEEDAKETVQIHSNHILTVRIASIRNNIQRRMQV